MAEQDESLAKRRAFLEALQSLDRSGGTTRKPLRQTESRERQPAAPGPALRPAAPRPAPQPTPRGPERAEAGSGSGKEPSPEQVIAEIGASVRAEASRVFNLPPREEPRAKSEDNVMSHDEGDLQAARKDATSGQTGPRLAASREAPRAAVKAPPAQPQPVKRLAEVEVRAEDVRSKGAFLDLVRQALSRELEGWLDQNLERVVEDIVREEIGRMGREAKQQVSTLDADSHGDREKRTGS